MKHRLIYIAFRFASALFGAFPEPLMRRTGEWLGRRWAGRNAKKRPMLSSHMRRVLGPEASEAAIEQAVDDMHQSYGRYWAETFWLRPKRHQSVSDGVERIGFNYVFDALATGRGVIFALPHLGNWEVAGLIADEIGARVLAVAEDLPNPYITEWFVDVRNQLGIDIVLTTDPQRRSKLIRRLKSGGVIALLADRDVTGRGLTTEFFGEEAKMPSGPVGLAAVTGAVLVPVASFFQEGAGHRIEVFPPIEIPDIEPRDQRTIAAAAIMASSLEDIIGQDPAQWHLFQPNWPSDDRFL